MFDELYKQDALESQSVLKETWRIMISDEGIQNRSNALGGGMIGAFLFSMFHVLFGATGAKVVAILIIFHWNCFSHRKSFCSDDR